MQFGQVNSVANARSSLSRSSEYKDNDAAKNLRKCNRFNWSIVLLFNEVAKILLKGLNHVFRFVTNA